MTNQATVGAGGRSGDAAGKALRRRKTLAFTLIELLVVISIIGVLAALIIPLSGVAVTKMRIARVKTEMNALVTAIENYKLEVGEYPPDNGKLFELSATDRPRDYWTNAAVNPLFYELVGAVFASNRFTTVAGSEVLQIDTLGKVFSRSGVRNSARNRFDVPYKGFSPKPSQYAELPAALANNQDVEVLAVPVPGPFMLAEGAVKINPWLYDASSTNRHNKESFDLWTEISIGNKTMIIGNWKN
jgi:prepilin-type N-terminal cleavage/methylation domain-containing protein